MNTPSQEIESRLRLVRTRIRQAQVKRSAWIIVTVFLGSLILIMAADYIFSPLPVAIRWILLVAWIIALLVAAGKVLLPLRREISLIQIARWIEARHPEMQERLSTVLELSSNDSGVSAGLLEALGKAANEDVIAVDARGEVRAAQKKMRWARPAAGLAGLLALSLLVWPKETSRLLVRAVAPFSNIGNAGAGKFKITPGDIEVMEGDRVEINVQHEGSAEEIDILIELAGRKEISQTLSRKGEDFRYVLYPARETFTYRLQSGRAQSDLYKVTVWPLPKMADARVTYDYLPYTGREKLDSPLGKSIEAVEGTTVTLSGKLNSPAERGWIEINGKRSAEGKLTNSAGGSRVEFAWTLSTVVSGEAVVKIKHRLGREIEVLRIPVDVLPDQDPRVAITIPSKKDLKVRPDELLYVQYDVAEDFSISKCAVEMEAGSDRKQMLDIPTAKSGDRPGVFQGSTTVSIGQLRSRFPGVNDMRIRIRAEDNRPKDLGGPGIGYSGWITLQIDQNAESLARQELRAEHDEARETIEKAIQQTRQARDQMDPLREDLKKGALKENSVERFEQSTAKLAVAQEAVAKLAKEMETGIHASKAQGVSKAAEEINRSREQLENAPLQDDPQAREQKLTDSRQSAEDAIKQLEEVRNAMDRDREKVQDLARMQDLAQRQQELARQASESMDKPASPQEQQEWKNQQQRMTDELRQQLRERADARAEELRREADKAKAMAKQAREISEAQKELQQQAQQASQPAPASLKDEVRKALTEEQEKITTEARKQLDQAQQEGASAADILPEATAAADAALDQMKKDQPQAAADSAKQAAAALKEAGTPKTSARPESGTESPGTSAADAVAEALQAKASDELATRQEKMAGAMEALAKDDVNAALQALQQARAESASSLAEEIKQMPLIDQTGYMNQAGDAARRGSEQAKEAGKQGSSGQQQQAAQQHEQSSQSFNRAAESLERASDELEARVAQAAGEQTNPSKAQMPAKELARAFQQAGEASQSQGAQSAKSASEAAKALSQAASQARQQMQGRPGPPAMSNPPGQPGPPGQQASDQMQDLQQRSADPGVPPELAKLGITAADWEKIQATLNSDSSGAGADAVPEEYRGLVKGYFESMSKKKD